MCGYPSAYGPARLPKEPTAALPGSEEKIRIMTERASRREQLFHPLDGLPASAMLAAAASVPPTWTPEPTPAEPAAEAPAELLALALIEAESDEADEPAEITLDREPEVVPVG